jgi:hypothetical protein
MHHKKIKTVRHLLCVALLMTCTWASAQNGPATIPKSDDPRVDRLIQKANERVAAGESTAVVERWLGDAVDRLGIEKSPQAWDVYGRQHWKDREHPAAEQLATP